MLFRRVSPLKVTKFEIEQKTFFSKKHNIGFDNTDYIDLPCVFNGIRHNVGSEGFGTNYIIFPTWGEKYKETFCTQLKLALATPHGFTNNSSRSTAHVQKSLVVVCALKCRSSSTAASCCNHFRSQFRCTKLSLSPVLPWHSQ